MLVHVTGGLCIFGIQESLNGDFAEPLCTLEVMGLASLDFNYLWLGIEEHIYR